MAFRITVKTNIDVPKTVSAVRGDEFWKFAATEWWRLISEYTPRDTRNLIQNVDIRPKEIEYKSPYSHYMYEGKVMGPNYYNPDYGFWSPPGQKKHYTGAELKYTNPKASKEWDKAAEPIQGPKLVQAMQGYIDSGRLNLNE